MKLFPFIELFILYMCLFLVLNLTEQSHLDRMILNFPEFGRFFTPTRSLGFLVAGIVDT